MAIFSYVTLFLYGIVIGSFLNVCICRIPIRADIVRKHSYCPHCGNRISWYDLIPVVSWFLLKGRCRTCKEKISIQYPAVELSNGILWAMTAVFCGIHPASILYCLLISALLVLSVIDSRTYEIPFGINVCIGVLGIVHLVFDYKNFPIYIIGFFLVSGIFQICIFLTKGKGMGGGDVKLMAAAGLLLGWKLILFAMIAGCFYGSVIHSIRMKVSGAGSRLAMGPYLSMGILTAIWFGERFINWYQTLFE